MNYRKILNAVTIFVIVNALISCGKTTKIADNEFILKKNIVEINTKKINKENVFMYVKQKPATFRIFKKTSPVIFDKELVADSRSNIQEYVKQLGYYSGKIKDTVMYKGKGAIVVYKIEVEDPLLVDKLVYDIADKNIEKIVFADTADTKIKKGRRLSTEMLEAERERITSNLRNNGFFDFNKTYITYKADSTQGRQSVKLKIKIENPSTINDDGTRKYGNHKQYIVKNVYIYTDYDGVKAFQNTDYFDLMDTVNVNGINIIYNQNQNINPKLFKRINLINRNESYSEKNVNQTYNNLTNLNLFKNLRIEFDKTENSDNKTQSELDCHIYLTPLTLQGYNVGLEVSTNSSGHWGISPSLGYLHRNLFKGSEQFELNLSGLYQFKVGDGGGYKKSTEFTVTTSLDIPKFLMPVQINYFKKYIPHTKLSVDYQYQKRNIYTRTLAGASFGYEWKSSDLTRFSLNPIELKIVKLKDLDQEFFDNIKKDPYVKSLYENHFSLGLSSSFTHTDQFKTYTKSTHYFRLNFDIAGNFMSLFNPLLKKDEDNKRLIFDTRYAQYARIDATFTRNRILNKTSKFVYRLFAGVGKAYGNSISMPFEKMYYSGGANSLRGWQVRCVGPGSAKPDTVYSIPNQVADFKLEFNAEWRFKIAWVLEGALFFDAGNIWTLNNSDKREGAKFEFDTFFKTIATNTGIGARLNFGIFTFRLDWGFRIHDPALEAHRFVKVKDWLKKGRNALHFGINYPF